MARTYLYEFDIDNLELSASGLSFAVAAQGVIEYTVTPYFAGSYDRGLAPEPSEVNIEDIGFHNLTAFTDGGIEHDLIKKGQILRQKLESVPLATILDLIESTNEFDNLSYYMLEQAQSDNQYEEDDYSRD